MQAPWVDPESAGRQSRQSVCGARMIRDGRNARRLVDRHQVFGAREYRDLQVGARRKGGGDLDHVSFTQGFIFPEYTFASHENAPLGDGTRVHARMRERVSDRATVARGDDVSLRSLHGGRKPIARARRFRDPRRYEGHLRPESYEWPRPR
jgi:hypothetical protein